MSHPNRPSLSTALVLALLALGLAACATSGPPPQPEAPQVAPVPLLPSAFPAQDIVGRWGLAAYHRDEDRERIQVAASNQCKQPYVITLGPTGGVMMHLADQATPEELRLKGAPGNKTYIGPQGDPPGGAQDRFVVSFDGRVLILRWMDPEVQSRYGTMVYVRCPPEGAKRPARPKGKPKPKPAAKPKPVQPPIQNAPPAR
jgi:predicted small lipoprotein YifL